MRQIHNINLLLRIVIVTVAAIIAITADAARRTEIKGIVVDSITQEPLPYVAVFLKGTQHGTMTDANGEFHVATNADFKEVTAAQMGYGDKSVPIALGMYNDVRLELVPIGITVKEVVVKPKKEKYSKKDNPAVELMKRLRARRDKGDPRLHDYYHANRYEKMTFALNDFNISKREGWIMQKFGFIQDYVDTSEISGKPILNISVKEKVSDIYFRRSPHSEKEVISGIRRQGLDDAVDEESVQRFADEVFREIDIFGNDITILQNRFVSPLSHIGVDYYKYYLTDTIPIGGEECIELSFVPFTPESFGFTGRIYVSLADTSLFVKRVVLSIPRASNVNYLESLYASQDYERGDDGTRLKKTDDMLAEFRLVKGTQGVSVRRYLGYISHDFEPPPSADIFKIDGPRTEIAEARLQPDEFWNDNRMTPIDAQENAVGRLVTRLRQTPVFYWTEKVLLALIGGYVPTGNPSKFDFGPMNTTMSGNALEGFRLRVGGLTRAALNNHLFARGYLAYGFRDKKLKYNAELEYSFNAKKSHSREFPIHSLKASYLYDVDQLGQHYQFTNTDNMFLAIKRQTNDKLIYQRVARLEYTLERKSGFSVVAGFQHQRHIDSKFLHFVNGYGETCGSYDETSFDIQLRYAPGEKFYQTRSNRYPINIDMPIFVLKHTFAPKGFFGSRYCVNKTEISVQKRFWFSAFGYTDIILKGGKIWSSVPYPDLLLPNANLSYTIQPESFALMNAMEFMNDQYLQWDLTYWLNGALFNRIPLVKYLKLREVISFRGLWGSLSDRNKPELNPDLFRFPDNALCQPMRSTPYMELGVGIDNIFTFLRLDYVWRLTYRDTPGINRGGVRIQLHFTF